MQIIFFKGINNEWEEAIRTEIEKASKETLSNGILSVSTLVSSWKPQINIEKWKKPAITTATKYEKC